MRAASALAREWEVLGRRDREGGEARGGGWLQQRGRDRMPETSLTRQMSPGTTQARVPASSSEHGADRTRARAGPA